MVAYSFGAQVFLPYVPTGMGYQLNLSLQRHATNLNAIALVDKTLTIVDGTGKGQTGTIVAYDPETRSYTVRMDGTWADQPDGTSKYEISCRMANEYPTNRPTTDEHLVVLTAQPTNTTTAAATPLPTLTHYTSQ